MWKMCGPSSMSRTRKLVPPRSSARNLPHSAKRKNYELRSYYARPKGRQKIPIGTRCRFAITNGQHANIFMFASTRSRLSTKNFTFVSFFFKEYLPKLGIEAKSIILSYTKITSRQEVKQCSHRQKRI